MEYHLSKKPKGVKTLIEGFPGMGLIGTIVTEFLLEHLKFEKIGEFIFDELPPTVAIHKGELVQPLAIFYNEKFKLVILHAIVDIKGVEWLIADQVSKLAKELGVKEIISLEGVVSEGGEDLYCFNNKKFEELGAKPIGESVIMGVTASLLLREKNLSCLFAQTHSSMPDSRAAAQMMEFLDKYLGFKIDTKPLLLQADIFEKKIKDIMRQTKNTQSEAERKQMSYLG
ncbi:MAG: proteasome assembly chaperone family protein [Nanoarchaeota archaeon]|nr:proteasome assembly chaperone family protein [Nanoarchaeota archaeon]